jgi:hypothetical protein
MRFTIDVTQVTGGWEVRLLDPATQQPIVDRATGQPLLAPSPRLLRVVDLAGELFPLPPADGADQLPAGFDPAQLSSALQDVLNQSAGSGGVERFGRYLFSTLLGQELWGRIDAVAGDQPVELALTWAADDPAFNRLPWEIMHSGREDPTKPYEGFLAAEPDVFITRRVRGTGGPTYALDTLPSPPRVLFVIGSPLNDPVIRPGAEYLGLLKHLEESQRQVHSRVLVEATAADVTQAIREFRPNVVHIICHGWLRDDGPSLELRLKRGSTEPDYVTAERLNLILKTEENLPLPSVVVLNACSTAAVDEVTVGRPLAAELVELGVPIVVGMSGKIEDQACRMFTRGFFGTLLAGGEVARAAARGRRAAIAFGGYDPRTQVDWALPSLYMAEAVGDASIEVQVIDEELERLRQALEFSKQPEFPAFCGRWDVFELYRELMSESQHQFLAVAAPRSDPTNPAAPPARYGSTRLLKELAAQAMRDGHIPILVSKDWLMQKNWPSGMDDFLDVVVKAVNKTIELLSGITRHTTLRESWDWAYLPMVRAAGSGAPIPEALPAELKRYGLAEEERLAKAFMLDLLDLRRTVCAQRGLDEEADVKLLLLIEDYHKLLFGDRLFALLGQYGLRDDRAVAKARAVIAYNSIPVDGQHQTVKDITDWANSHDVTAVQLGTLHGYVDPYRPLESPESFEQAALVYRHFLMNWRHGDRKKPLCITRSDNTAEVSNFIATLVDATSGGVPSELDQRPVSVFIASHARENRLLRHADDEDALEHLQRDLRKRVARP